MSKKYDVQPTNDYVFRRIFGYPGNEKITEDMISEIIGEKLEIESLDCEKILPENLKSDKIGILDVRAKEKNNSQVNIEMQVVEKYNIVDRIMFYWSKLFISSLKSGENYSELKRTIVILIANFEIEKLKEIERFITKWKIREEKNQNIILTEKLEIYIIELPKIKMTIKEKYREKLLSWMKFIQNPESLEEKEMNKYEKIQEAGKILDYINEDEHEKWLAEQRMIYKMDQNAVEEFGYHKGKKDEKIRIAKNLLKKNMNLKEISEITGLSQKEIEEIKERL